MILSVLVIDFFCKCIYISFLSVLIFFGCFFKKFNSISFVGFIFFFIDCVGVLVDLNLLLFRVLFMFFLVIFIFVFFLLINVDDDLVGDRDVIWVRVCFGKFKLRFVISKVLLKKILVR